MALVKLVSLLKSQLLVIQLNKIVQSFRSENLPFKITNVRDIEQISVICFSHATFAILKNKCSQCGYTMFMYSKNVILFLQ